MKTIKVKKGEILQRKGELKSKIYIVQSGLLRSYTIDNKGKEHMFMFAPENWIIGDNISPEKPSELFIDALEDSVVIQKEKDSTISDSKKLINRLETLQKRIILLMSATALERYEDFIQTYPKIVQRVPQKLIASYLGITPEALSTVKKMRMKK